MAAATSRCACLCKASQERVVAKLLLLLLLLGCDVELRVSAKLVQALNK